jgi:glucose/arabinose dehydrogenase
MIKILIIYSFFATLIFADLGVEKIAGGFDKPVYVLPIPQTDNELLVLEQKGIAYHVKDKKVLKKPFLDIKDRVHRPLFPGDERGFLGFTFDPNYKENSFFYVHYNDKNDHTIISRFKVNGQSADKTSEKIILKLEQPYSNHNGGTIEFRKDGYLYIGLGDGGSAGDPEKRAQDPTNLFGKILRIDVNTEKPYLSPKSNPFVKYRKFKDEIWSYGLRNPWRFSFDALTGDMIIGDVGQYLWEEINIEYYGEEGGKNYGWNIMEGNHCFPEDVKDCYDEQ